MADADPRGDARADHQQQDRRPRPARLGPLGRRARSPRAFLREFTAGLPWAHLDIAGPSFNSGSAWGHTTAGGTGFAVATLVDYARTLAG